MCWMTRFIGVVVIESLSAVASRLPCNPRRQAVCSVILAKSWPGANRPHTPPVEPSGVSGPCQLGSIRTILVHQLHSERRFFAQFVGTEEPPVEELLPGGEKPVVQAYIDKYIWLVKRRLPQLAQGTAAWWLESRPFFGGLQRERIWVFWRRVLHTCHHRTQVQTWLRLAGHEPVPAIYGPSGDVKWDEADPTYSLEAAKRGG
jgi:uncharacterized damage-inducible protein DinB